MLRYKDIRSRVYATDSVIYASNKVIQQLSSTRDDDVEYF
jgi:hypothetical protein